MGGTPAKGGMPAPNGEIGWGGIHTYARRPRGRAMWSTFERRPGRSFGVNNLKHPHTLASQENETVSGGCSASARFSESCSVRCTPLLEYDAVIRLPRRIGDTEVSPIRGRVTPHSRLPEADSPHV